MANILFLESGTQTLAVLRPLAKDGNKIFIIASEKGNYADMSRYVCKVYYNKEHIESKEYWNLLVKVVKENSIDTVIPSGDIAAEFVSKHLGELSKLVYIKAPTYDIFLKGYDKNKLMAICRAKGYPHPITIDMSETSLNDSDTFQKFPYPGILKPNCTTGGRGMSIINNYEELKRIYPKTKEQFGECHFQRFVKEGGHQVKVQLYVDEKGNLVNYSVLDKVRWYPVKGGSSCCAISIENPEMVDICHNILKEIHWVGFADFDTIEDADTHELLIMEINPRIPACIGAALKAGINWGQIIVDANLGNEQQTYKYETGHVLRHLGFDVLWFLKSPKRFKAKPSWFHFFGHKISYQDFALCDMKPFIVGTYHNVKKLFDPNFKKSKQGA